MALLPEYDVGSLADIARVENEMTLEQRLPERSVFDVFVGTSARQPDRTALTMLMTGAPDEKPRRVSSTRTRRRSVRLRARRMSPRPSIRSTSSTALWCAICNRSARTPMLAGAAEGIPLRASRSMCCWGSSPAARAARSLKCRNRRSR